MDRWATFRELGREYPGILTNTISSFGLGDQEFVVAIEGDDPREIMEMMRHLRGAEVRTFTSYDTPIYLTRYDRQWKHLHTRSGERHDTNYSAATRRA